MTDDKSELHPNVTLVGTIMLNEGDMWDCVIAAHAVSGARLQVTSVAGIPDQFLLRIGSREEQRLAVVEWRKQGEIGVRFAA